MKKLFLSILMAGTIAFSMKGLDLNKYEAVLPALQGIYKQIPSGVITDVQTAANDLNSEIQKLLKSGLANEFKDLLPTLVTTVQNIASGTATIENVKAIRKTIPQITKLLTAIKDNLDLPLLAKDAKKLFDNLDKLIQKLTDDEGIKNLNKLATALEIKIPNDQLKQASNALNDTTKYLPIIENLAKQIQGKIVELIG